MYLLKLRSKKKKKKWKGTIVGDGSSWRRERSAAGFECGCERVVDSNREGENMRKPNIEFSLIRAGSFILLFEKGEKRSLFSAVLRVNQFLLFFFFCHCGRMCIREECVWTDNETAVQNVYKSKLNPWKRFFWKRHKPVLLCPHCKNMKIDWLAYGQVTCFQCSAGGVGPLEDENGGFLTMGNKEHPAKPEDSPPQKKKNFYLFFFF